MVGDLEIICRKALDKRQDTSSTGSGGRAGRDAAKYRSDVGELWALPGDDFRSHCNTGSESSVSERHSPRPDSLF